MIRLRRRPRRPLTDDELVARQAYTAWLLWTGGGRGSRITKSRRAVATRRRPAHPPEQDERPRV